MIIDSAGIYKTAEDIAGLSGRDPFAAAGDRGVFIDYCGGFTALLGLYTVVNGERHIILNSNMSVVTSKIVCAHELGHDVLHGGELASRGGFCDASSFFRRTGTEYEANVFAAHLLIDGEELLDVLSETRNVITAAGRMNTELDLLLIKMNEMKRLGYDINVPMEANRNFLKDLGEDSFGIGDGFSDGV